MTTVGRFTVWIIAAVLVVIVVYFAGYRVANTLPAVLALALGNVGGESPKQWDNYRGCRRSGASTVGHARDELLTLRQLWRGCSADGRRR